MLQIFMVCLKIYPLENSNRLIDRFVGETGIDGTNLLPTAAAPPSRDRSPILAIRDALLAQPKNAPWVVATGALTNIALLFGTFPEVVGHIKGLSIMGGAIGGGFTNAPLGKVKGEGERFGNQTPWAEFNIYVSTRTSKMSRSCECTPEADVDPV